MTDVPLVTVAIRSHMRLAAAIELIRRCQAQDYPRFEIVVIEQSEPVREQFRDQLDEIDRDPRVHLIECPRLGYIRARNEAIQHARGEIILFMDDDDLPVGEDWISRHAANYRDPLCVAVTGREVTSEDEDPARHDNLWNHLMCLRYSPVLKLPMALNRHSRRIEGVESIKGGGTSIRRSVIDRVGLWEEDHDDVPHEEQYFNFKFQRLRRPGEYYVYDPTAVILRRLDIPGGMDRRTAPAHDVLYHELFYSHTIIRRFFPLRFYSCYPAYLAAHAGRALEQLYRTRPDEPLHRLAGELLRDFLPALVEAWR